MDNRNNKQPIIQNISASANYPFEAIASDVVDLFQVIAVDLGRIRSFPPLLRAFECFHQITRQELKLEDIDSPGFELRCTQFFGALNSARFINLTEGQRYAYSNLFRLILEKLPRRSSSRTDIKISVSRPSAYILCCIAEFEKMELAEDRAWLWHGWSTRNQNGRVTQLPFYGVFHRMGKDFTERLHEACAQYYSGRKCQRIIALNELSSFISSYSRELRPADLLSSPYVTRFWREFFIYYVETGHAAGVGVSLLITNWNNEFVYFAKTYLVGSGLFAAPLGAYPGARPTIPKKARRTNIKKTSNNTEVHAKLLTHVPLTVTDSEAMDLLFRQIRKDVETACTWARSAVAELWERYKRRVEYAAVGQVRIIGKSAINNGGRWLANRTNPDYLKNIAATFEHHGYLTREDTHLTCLYGSPIGPAADDLGLPTTGALLPFCTLLVAHHPQITPSFLEKLELYDKHGNCAGFVQTNSGHALVGTKDRRGPLKSQQVIQLNSETAKIVSQIAALTAPLRDYLRRRGDDSWRRLLLTCGKGFSYPKPVDRIATDTSHPRRLAILARSVAQTCDLSANEGRAYVKRFSLPALRASAGVLVYLETRDVKKMSEALGHAEYSRDLLLRYLPAAILEFFQERWIRLFQTGIIVEAMSTSPYLLDAANFSSLEELNEFLTNHALKQVPETKEKKIPNTPTASSKDEEVLISVDAGVLTMLLSLQLAVQHSEQTPNGTAMYWAEVSQKICSYILSDACKRDDLKSYLSLAIQHAEPKRFERIIYG